MKRSALVGTALALGLFGVVFGVVAVNSIIGLVTMRGESPGMGFSVLLPIAIIAGVIAAGCGVGVAVCIQALGRRNS